MDTVSAMTEERQQVQEEIRRVSEAGNTLEEIGRSSTVAAERSQRICLATIEQLHRTQEIVQAMQQVSTIANWISERSESIRHKTTDLVESAQDLEEVLSPMYHYGDFEVQDDGSGFNDDVLESRGRELGLLPLGETVSQKQMWKLIFYPGFSTKSSVSEISGRGVGMDVVDSWVRRLRGSIDVESVPGQGTTFRLQIPLRSAVEHAMVVRSGGQLFALPMHAVSGTSDARLPASGLPRDASAARVVALGHLLGPAQGQTTRCSHVMLRNTASAPQSAQRRAGLNVTIAVDAIVGVEEVVVRSLPPLLQRNELFAGVTLSGRAETVLLLDARKLIELSQRSEQVARENPVANLDDDIAEDPDGDCILIVDDSVAVRRSLSKKLSAAGHRVREASNGRDALDLLKSSGFAAVVSDIDMPVMNGIELLQEIRRRRELQAIAVTVLTSRDEGSLSPQSPISTRPPS